MKTTNNNNTTFSCKFCHEVKPYSQEASAHKKMCKSCYSDTVKYRRVISKQNVSVKDLTFINRFEKQCRHNESIGAYVPRSYYNNKGNLKVDRCPCCGAINVKAYPSAPHMCYECGRMEHNYRSTVRKLRKGTSDDSTFVRRLARVQSIERLYLIRDRAGLKVPDIYLENRGPNGYTHFK